MRRLRIVVGLLLVATLGGPVLAGCAKAGGGVRPGAADDATLATHVKTVFINDLDVGALTIDVETSSGVVTLSGRVHTGEQETRAIELARTVPGVTDVRSSLQIRP